MQLANAYAVLATLNVIEKIGAANSFLSDRFTVADAYADSQMDGWNGWMD